MLKHNIKTATLIPAWRRPRILPFLNMTTSASLGLVLSASGLKGSTPSIARFTRNPIEFTSECKRLTVACICMNKVHLSSLFGCFSLPSFTHSFWMFSHFPRSLTPSLLFPPAALNHPLLSSCLHCLAGVRAHVCVHVMCVVCVCGHMCKCLRTDTVTVPKSRQGLLMPCRRLLSAVPAHTHTRAASMGRAGRGLRLHTNQHARTYA